MTTAAARSIALLALLFAAGCVAGTPVSGDDPIRLTPMSAEEAGAITVSFRFPEPTTYRLAVIPFDMASVRVTLTSPRLTSDRSAVYNVTGAPSDTTFTKLRPGDYVVNAYAYTLINAGGANVALATSKTITVTGGGTPQPVVLRMHLAPFTGRVQ
jgi:hypothetical protein